MLIVNAAIEAALCGAAKSPGIAVRVILLEKLANAVLDHIDILQGDAETGGNFLCGNLGMLAKDKNPEIAERDVLLSLEDLKSPDESILASLGIHGETLEPRGKHVLKRFGSEFNILRMEFETAPDVAEERPSLPMEVGKPVAFALRVLFTVCCDVFAMHELVEGKLHRVFAIGETIVAVEAIDELGAELFVEFAPGFIIEDHFIFHTPNTIKCFQAC